MRSFIREKKIFCGSEYLEVDIFPYTETRRQREKSGRKRSKKKQVTQPTQEQINLEYTRRFASQLVKTNFTAQDLHVSLTYQDKFLPVNVEEAEKELKNFRDRVKRLRAKRGLPPLKYIQVTEYSTNPDHSIRIHHHIIMSGGLTREEIENLWCRPRKKGEKQGEPIGYANADRLQPDTDGLESLVRYIIKYAAGKKKYTTSRNLEKPNRIVTDGDEPTPKRSQHFSFSNGLTQPYYRTNDHKYTRRKLENIAKNPPDAAYWEKLYPGYTIMSYPKAFQAVYNDDTGWSVYVKLRKKE